MVDLPTLILISAIMLLIGTAVGFALSMLRSGQGAAIHEEKPQPSGKEAAPVPIVSNTPAEELGRTPEPPAAATPNVEQERAARYNPLDIFARALTSDVPKPQPMQSLAAQIDAILQERLEESHLATRGIRLQEHPVQGLVVQVGLNRYNSIDEVPEKEIRDFIREAIAEWESQVGGS